MINCTFIVFYLCITSPPPDDRALFAWSLGFSLLLRLHLLARRCDCDCLVIEVLYAKLQADEPIPLVPLPLQTVGGFTVIIQFVPWYRDRIAPGQNLITLKEIIY
jgi:hypothetical protein